MSDTKNFEGEYNSTDGFVFQNGLEKEAELLFGKNWEAQDDVYQIEQLIEDIGEKFYKVTFIEGKGEDDIRVEKSVELERIDMLEKKLATTEKLDNTVLELTLRTLKSQMEDGNTDRRYALFLAIINNGLGISNEPKTFLIDGYYKDDGAPFDSYKVAEFHDSPENDEDDDIFFYGLSEENIKEAIELKENTAHDFVITNYRIL